MKAFSLSATVILLAVTSPRLGPQTLPPWAERLGWTLVHSTWQLAAIALLAALLLRITRSQSSNARYSLSVTLLGLMVIAPGVTWNVIAVPSPHDRPLTAHTPSEVTTVQIERRERKTFPSESVPPSEAFDSGPTPDRPSQPAADLPPARMTAVEVFAAVFSDPIHRSLMQIRDLIAPCLPLLVTLWSLGVVLGSFRPALGLWMHWRLKSRGLAVVSPELQTRFAELARRLGVRHAVRLAESALIKVPLVVGYLRPLVLLPASVLSGLPMPQLEAVLAHELSHIRRHDWVINALQVLVETLLFYHPAVWWLSRRIHHERELCCDDLALAVIGDRATYGRALLALEHLRQHAPTPLLAATGGELVTRVRRLLPNEPRTARAPRPWVGGSSLVVLLVAAGATSLLLQAPALSMNDKSPATNAEPKEVGVQVTPKERRAPLQPLPEGLKKWDGQGVSANYDEDGQVISVYLGRPTTDAMLAELASLPRLRELHIETTKNVTAAGLSQLSKLKQLEKASFYNVNESGAELGDAVIRSVAGLQSLRELVVGECGTTDEGCRVLAQMSQLTTLSLHQEGRLTDAALKSIGSLKQLKSLSLGSVVATERLGRMQFSAAGLASLQELSELEVLHLHGHPVTAAVLASNKLRQLSLGHPAVNDDVAARLAELGHLQQLNLGFTGITDDGLKQLGALKQLQHLDIGSYVVSDAGVAAFEQHPTLRYVNLRLSKLTNVGVKSMVTIPNLENLSLWEGGPSEIDRGPPQLTIVGLKPLVAAPKLRTLSLTRWQSRGNWLALKEFKQLERLSFLMCDILPSDVDALEAALPGVQIFHATGGGTVVPQSPFVSGVVVDDGGNPAQDRTSGM